MKPSIGRVIWFHPEAGDKFITTQDNQPVPALICGIHSDTQINVGGFDFNGLPFARQGVRLLEVGESPTEGEAYAEWMPYQIQQAAASEEPASA